MEPDDDAPLCPVAQFDIGVVRQHGGFILLRPHFLLRPGQPPDEAEASRFYALTTAQVHDLISRLQEAAHSLATGAVAGTQHLPH